MTRAANFNDALRSYWDVRDAQSLTGTGEGSGAAVRGGRHFDALQLLVASVFLDAGFGPGQLFTGRNATLPGYFRPTKDWDLIVVDGRTLVAAFELKSLAGPSFGNNFNNRTEEAIGNATDLWRAAGHGSLGAVKPWLGYFFLIEDAEASRRPVSNRVRSGEIAAELHGLSYQERAKNLCRRLKSENLYDAVCFAASSRNPADAPCDPIPDLSWDAFVAAIEARITFLGALGSGSDR